MKLILLGTSGYYANDRRHTACLMLPEVGVVLDAGSGMYRIRDYLASDRLDVFLTHAHLDHVIGLTYLIDVLSRDVLANTIVYGAPEKLSAVREHLFAESLFPVPPSFRLAPLGPICPLRGNGTLSHFPLKHPGGSLGFRLDWPDRSFAYVTDTTAKPDSDYIERIRGVNLLVHEAYFPDGEDRMAEITGHSCLSDVVRVAASAQVERLVLVHVSPQLRKDTDVDLKSAQQIFKNTQLGTDRMEIEF
jgi:ribonuclease BN (tRNA processing enzyme)